MDAVFEEFRYAITEGGGNAVAVTLSPIPPANNAGRLYSFHRSSNPYQIDSDVRSAIIYNKTMHLPKQERNAWHEVFVNYWKAVGEILAAEEAENSGTLRDDQYDAVYEAWKALTNTLIKYYSSSTLPAWTIPCLYSTGKYLRVFAIRADEQSAHAKGDVTFNSGYQDDIVSTGEQNDKLEDAARVFNRMFAICVNDRAPLEESRKWGTYYIANLQFKTYFRLNNISLSKNIVKSIEAAKGPHGTELPQDYQFPKSHIITFKYYVGVLAFLQEDYKQAEENLTQAWQLCHKDAKKNQELILTYLIPVRLVSEHVLPTAAFLSNFPRLQALFGPLASCIKHGDLGGFDAALVAGEDEFVKRRIYLTLERGRDVALRNLLRKVYLAGGYEPLKEGETEAERARRARVPIDEFAAALKLGMGADAQPLDRDEVECIIANQIYKGLMKGYISRSHGLVVLNKKGVVFPGTGV